MTESGIELQGVVNHVGERQFQVNCALADALFGYLFGRKEAAEGKQIGCGAMLAANLLKGKGEGFGDRERMIRMAVALVQQHHWSILQEIEKVGQAALRFLDIGASLVEGERKTIHYGRDATGERDIAGASAIIQGMDGEILGMAQQQECSFLGSHLL